MDETEEESKMDRLEQFLAFTEQAPTAFHATACFRNLLMEKGFRELKETDPWLPEAGGKYFVVRNDAALIAFEVPETGFAPFRIAAAHGDSPTFRLKERFEDRGKVYVRLNVEKYGGMIMSSWLDRPLSVAGRLAVREGKHVGIRLVCLDRDAVLIPNLPIHVNREVNNGYKYDPQTDLMPLYGTAENPGCLMDEIAQAAGVKKEDILSHDLFLYNRERPAVWGQENAFFSCARIDDLECAWAAVTALTESAAKNAINVCAVFDHEEVGSASRQGADSSFLSDTLTRAGRALGASDCEIRAAVAGSFMVSADNAHALHPNHPEFFDAQNQVFMNQGVVIKHHAGQKYTTDAVSSARFTLLCEQAGVPVQHFANRSDQPGGSTLGNIANTHVSMETVDIGLAQLAMHSVYETAGTKDLDFLIRALSALYSLSD